MATAEPLQQLRALYVRPVDVTPKPHPELHLERLLWSYNSELVVEWAVSYGWPEIPPLTEGEQPTFAVAFIDEAAVPEAVREKGITGAMVHAQALVWVSRSIKPSSAVPILDDCAVLERPLSYDRFCQTCAKILNPSVTAFPGRFEYHTFDVLQDIWSEAAVAEGEAPVPRSRYSLDDALNPNRCEGIVITRRVPSFTLLYANKAFWDKVGWPESSGLGQNLRFLQGPLTQADVVAQLHERISGESMRDHSLGDWNGTLLNYTKNGQTFHNKLHVSPCTDAALYIGRVSINDEPEKVFEPSPPEAQPQAMPPARGIVADHEFASTLAAVLLDLNENVVVTRAEAPFPIVYVNDAWCDLCGFKPDQVVGKTLKTIQGPRTDTQRITQCMTQLMETRDAVEMNIINYKHHGIPFHNRVVVEPLKDRDGAVRYMVGRLHEELPQPMDMDVLPAAVGAY